MLKDEFKDYLISSGIGCTDEQWGQVCGYYSLLEEWNKKINLVSRAMLVDKIWGVLFYDSLAPLMAGILQKNARCVDVGTGAGFPGILLSIFRPDLDFVLLDSLQKRTRFLGIVRQELGLANVDVSWGRAENIAKSPELAHRFDYVLFKAVTAAAGCMRLGAPFLKKTGTIIMYKGLSIEDELAEAKRDFPRYTYIAINYFNSDQIQQRQLIQVDKVL